MQVIGEAVVQVRPDLSKFDQNLTADLKSKITPAAQSAGQQAGQQLSSALTKEGEAGGKQAGVAISQGLKTTLAAGLGTVAALGIRKLVTDVIGEAQEAQRVGAQTDAVLKSTGAQAGLTADEIGNLAQTISDKTAIDDEQIQAGENMLLTFKNVRNEVGANNDIFSQAASISVDMAAAFAAVNGGTVDLKSSSIQLGKALNDPVRGITALTRVGVTFDAQQKERIKNFVQEGNLVGAQKVILAELRSEFEGSAAAQATASDRVNVAVKNLEESIGVALLPILDKAATVVAFLADTFISLPAPIRETAVVVTLGAVALLGFIKVAQALQGLQGSLGQLGGVGTAASGIAKGFAVAEVGVASFGITYAALKGPIEGLSIGHRIESDLGKVDKAIGDLASKTDAQLLPTFRKIAAARRSAIEDSNNNPDIFGHTTDIVTGDKLLDQLAVFRQLAEADRGAALRLAEQMRRAGVDTKAFEVVLAQTASQHKINATETQNHVDKMQALSGTLDTTDARFKNSIKVFGDWGTQTAIALGVPAKQLERIATLSVNFDKTLESQISASTNPFAKFANQAEVGTQEFEDFLVTSQRSAIEWAQEIQQAIGEGIDRGLIDKIAAAGPSSKPALDALIRVADEKGVEWVNSVAHSSDEVVKQTEQAYSRILVTTAIKGAEEAALRKGIQDLIEGDHGAHLQRLVTSNDKALSQMAQDALTQLGIIQSGVDGLHGKDIAIDFQIAAQFTGSNDLSALAALGGGDAIAEQFRRFLDGLGQPAQNMAGGTFSGWSWVGERGPELINVGSNTATVLPNDLSLAVAALAGKPVTSQTGQQSIDRSVNIGAITLPVEKDGAAAIDALFAKVEVEQFHARLP